MTKLDDAKAEEIRRTDGTVREVAAKFDVCPMTVSLVRRKVTWNGSPDRRRTGVIQERRGSVVIEFTPYGMGRRVKVTVPAFVLESLTESHIKRLVRKHILETGSGSDTFRVTSRLEITDGL